MTHIREDHFELFVILNEVVPIIYCFYTVIQKTNKNGFYKCSKPNG